MSFNVGPRVVSATGGSIKRVGNYRIHTFPSELVTDGLVLNLDAGDPRSYPGSGTTWTDLSGNGNNGTLTNSPTYSNANGGSLVFGSPTTTNVLVNTSGYGSGSFTISMWFNISTIPNTYHMLLGGSNYSGGTGIGHYLYNDTIRTWLSGGASINIYDSGSILSTGIWYDLVIAREYGIAWKWYLNGSLINTYTGNLTENYTSPNSYIGNHYNSASYPFVGKIASTKTYNRALSAAEVAQNYDALKVRYTSYTNTFTPTCGGGSGKVEVLCVAGGGGGGKNHGGGGGGGGGLIYNSAFNVSSNTGIGVTVGAGGQEQNNGSNTTFSSLTSIGGGAGATEGGSNGNSGGSGGGGSGYATPTDGGSGTTGQGFAGGRGAYPNTDNTYGHGGGGGGAGSAGTDGTEGNGATVGVAGTGGNGLSYSISGNSQFYAGGGGGGFWGTINGGGLGGSGIGGRGGENHGGGGANTRHGGNAIPNTGSGGGGSPGSPDANDNRIGGNGSNGIVIVRYPATDYNVELLIVGGGGGGGGSTGDAWNGGGGGAGGLIYYSSYPVSAGTKYSVTVGVGGTAGISTSSNNGSTTTQGANGGNSILGPLVAIGGGGGGASSGNGTGTGTKNNGLNGGSGGGGAISYNAASKSTGGVGVSGQGNSGGQGDTTGTGYSGGGGGAGGPGTGPGVHNVTNFGPGLVFSITGSSVSYAQGGQGGRDPVTNAAANSGTGGDGVRSAVNTLGQSGAGGSGIIIIAYQGPQRGIGGTVDTTSRPGYTLHKFTTTGTDFFIP